MIFCRESKIAKDVDLLEKIGFIRLKILFLSDRIALLQGLIVDRIKKNNTLLFYCESITNNE